VQEVLAFRHGQHDALPELVTIGANMKVGAAIDLMQRYSISQLPVVRQEPPESVNDVIGSLQERGVLERVFRNADAMSEDVAVAMQPPFGIADVSDTLDRVFQDLSGRREAVLVADGARPVAILTRSDLLEFLAAQRTHVDA
jgi:cystathionine beta-synthase